MNKHIAILPDNTIATRNSKTRVYTHCVAVRDCSEDAMKRALEAGNRKHVKESHEYAIRESNPQTARWNHTDEQLARFRADAALTFDEYQAKLIADEVAAVEENRANGYYSKWGVVGWNGRRDLAEKLAASEAGHAYRAEVKIIEVQMK